LLNPLDFIAGDGQRNLRGNGAERSSGCRELGRWENPMNENDTAVEIELLVTEGLGERCLKIFQ
jgi:hypothetical protein